MSDASTHPSAIHGHYNWKGTGRRSPTLESFEHIQEKNRVPYGSIWLTFVEFLKIMGLKPPGWVLTRLRPNEPHGPANSVYRPSRKTIPQTGRSSTKKYRWFGEDLYLWQIARKNAISLEVLTKRVEQQKWSLQRAVATGRAGESERPDDWDQYTYNNRIYTRKELKSLIEERKVVSFVCVIGRLYRGWSLKRAIETPPVKPGPKPKEFKVEDQSGSVTTP